MAWLTLSGRPLTNDEVTARADTRDPEYRLFSGEWNSFRKESQQMLIFRALFPHTPLDPLDPSRREACGGILNQTVWLISTNPQGPALWNPIFSFHRRMPTDTVRVLSQYSVTCVRHGSSYK
jgi:hypothetical protein